MNKTKLKSALKRIDILDFLCDNRTLSFLLPFTIMLVVFAILQVYPYGDKTVLTVDLYHQYMPFVYELRSKILEGRSLFYSWDSGLGTEYYAAFANYAASPLNILCIFFPYKTLPVFVAFVTCLRAGLASLFMGLLLSESDEKRYDFITVLFGMSYALSGWFLTDFWNIMWCDAFVMLPLIILGLRKLMTEGRYGLYIFSLGICIASNFYAGYFICLFLVIFAIPYYFSVFDKANIKSFGISAGRFAISSILAGMLSAIVVLPTYMILQHSSATGNEFPVDYNLTGNLFDFLGRLFVSANPNIRDGMANVACGTMIILLVPLFFIAPKETGIKLRHKIGFGTVLFILYLSFTNRMLNFIWHGFHFPNQIPYRESFLMSFILVLMAYMVIRSLREFSSSSITGVIAGAIAFVILYEKFGEGEEGYQQIGLTFLFLIIMSIVIKTISNGTPENGKRYIALMAAFMSLEIFASTVFTIGNVSKHEGFTGYDFYAKNRDIIKSYADEAEGSEGHLTFERTDLYPNNICCIQSVYDVKGMSTFSSTARENYVRYMRNFGFHNNGINSVRSCGLTRVTASLLNIRNFMTIENTSTVPMLYEPEYSNGEVISYGNKDALSVAYMVDGSFGNFEPLADDTDVFAKTNAWVQAMGVPADVYSPIDPSITFTSNVSEEGRIGNYYSYNVSMGESDVVITGVIDNATIGSDVYCYCDSNRGGNMSVTINGNNKSFEIRYYQAIYLGTFDGTPIEFTLTLSNASAGAIHLYTYELNVDGYQIMLDTLKDEQLSVSNYTDTAITGEIDVRNDGMLLFTVPYSEGFRIYVDGIESEVISVQDALIGVHLDAGHHEVILKYVPAGFKAGAAISFAGLFLALVAIFVSRRLSAKKVLADSLIVLEEDADSSEDIVIAEPEVIEVVENPDQNDEQE